MRQTQHMYTVYIISENIVMDNIYVSDVYVNVRMFRVFYGFTFTFYRVPEVTMSGCHVDQNSLITVHSSIAGRCSCI